MHFELVFKTSWIIFWTLLYYDFLLFVKDSLLIQVLNGII